MKSLKKPKKRYRIVIDANVIVSSIFGGYPAKVMEIAKSHILFAPTRLKKELETFLEKVRKRGDFTELINYFSYILHRIKFINIEDPKHVSRDRADDFYIAVALQENVDFLITGDKDILSCREIRNWSFKILTPKEFVEMIEGKL